MRDLFLKNPLQFRELSPPPQTWTCPRVSTYVYKRAGEQYTSIFFTKTYIRSSRSRSALECTSKIDDLSTGLAHFSGWSYRKREIGMEIVLWSTLQCRKGKLERTIAQCSRSFLRLFEPSIRTWDRFDIILSAADIHPIYSDTPRGDYTVCNPAVYCQNINERCREKKSWQKGKKCRASWQTTRLGLGYEWSRPRLRLRTMPSKRIGFPRLSLLLLLHPLRAILRFRWNVIFKKCSFARVRGLRSPTLRVLLIFFALNFILFAIPLYKYIQEYRTYTDKVHFFRIFSLSLCLFCTLLVSSFYQVK